MLTKSLKSRVATASMSAALTVTGALHAQPEGNASAADRERAIELFREARRLQEQGRPAEACELFRRSASLLPGPGILLNLGQCLEREGNAIGALETYERALAVARAHATASPEQRAAWVNLNGTWTFTYDPGKSGMARGLQKSTSFDQPITVPFCPESALSGVGNTDFIECLWYHRKLEIPAE